MTIFGPDISHWQSGFDVARAAREGAEFIIGKVSEGSGFKDPQWPVTRDAARAADLVLVGYHYVTTEDPAKQAAVCAAWIGDKSIPVALDWEDRGGNGANLLRVLAAFRAAGLNVRLIYTGAWYWQPNGAPDLSGTGCALWKSRYPNTTQGAPAALFSKVPANYWDGLGGLPTSLLQFTSTATVAGMAKVDCSAFQGTREQLAALLGYGPAPTPVPAPDEETDMTEADRQMLREVHFMLSALIWPQLAGHGADPLSSDPAKVFTGWPPLPAPIAPEKPKTLVDWVRNEAAADAETGS